MSNTSRGIYFLVPNTLKQDLKLACTNSGTQLGEAIRLGVSAFIAATKEQQKQNISEVKDNANNAI